METITVESIPIILGREEDGRWWADIESMPGVMAYGATRESAIAAVRETGTACCPRLHRTQRANSGGSELAPGGLCWAATRGCSRLSGGRAVE